MGFALFNILSIDGVEGLQADCFHAGVGNRACTRSHHTPLMQGDRSDKLHRTSDRYDTFRIGSLDIFEPGLLDIKINVWVGCQQAKRVNGPSSMDLWHDNAWVKVVAQRPLGPSTVDGSNGVHQSAVKIEENSFTLKCHGCLNVCRKPLCHDNLLRVVYRECDSVGDRLQNSFGTGVAIATCLDASKRKMDLSSDAG